MSNTTRKITVGMAALAAMAFVGFDSSQAEARSRFGLHYAGPAVHFDIGNPHGRSYRSRTVYNRPSTRTYYSSNRSRGHYDYHDTSHYDYHPGQFVRHGNHYDYQRGHYDFHRTGHYDYHRGGHGGGHNSGHNSGHHGGHH